MSLLAFGECVAVQAHASSGCEFSLNVVAVEHHRIVVGTSHFGFVAIKRSISAADVVLIASHHIHFGHRHHHHVAQVAATGAIEVSVRESYADAVAIMIARAPVPALVDIVRA